MESPPGCASYEIRIAGELGTAAVQALPALALRATAEDPRLLRGCFRDQAELHGVLTALEGLGVVLVEFHQEDSGAPGHV